MASRLGRPLSIGTEAVTAQRVLELLAGFKGCQGGPGIQLLLSQSPMLLSVTLTNSLDRRETWMDLFPWPAPGVLQGN